MELSLILRTLCNICCIALVASRGTRIYVPLDTKIGQGTSGNSQTGQRGTLLRPPTNNPGSRTYVFPTGQRPIVGQQRPSRPVLQRPVLQRPQVTTHRMPTILQNPVRTRPSANIPSRIPSRIPGRVPTQSRNPVRTSPLGNFPSRPQPNARPTIPRRTVPQSRVPPRTPVRTPIRTPPRTPARNNPYVSNTQLYSQSRIHSTQQVLTSRQLHVQQGALPKARTNGVCRYHGYYPIACCTGWKRIVNPSKPWTYSCEPLCKRKCKHGKCVGPGKCQCEAGYRGEFCDKACPTSTLPTTETMVEMMSHRSSEHPSPVAGKGSPKLPDTRGSTTIYSATLKPASTPKPNAMSEPTIIPELMTTTELLTTPDPTSAQSTTGKLTTLSTSPVLNWLDVFIMDNLAQQALLPDAKVSSVRQNAQEWPMTIDNSSQILLRHARGLRRPPPTLPIPPGQYGLTVMTLDGTAHEAPLPDVQIRIIRLTVQGGSETIANSLTDANGTMWVDIPVVNHVIVVASKQGYIDTSSAYHPKPGERNIHQISMQKHTLRREMTWMSGLDRLVEFRPRNREIPYSFDIPAGSLDVPEQSNVEFNFQDINTSDPEEMKQAPEIIGAVDTSEGTTLISLAVFSMAELTVVNTDTNELVELLLPFEAEFPLSRKPRGTRQGSRIIAWYFDKMTGVWRKGGTGKVRLNRFEEPMWSFQAQHFTWWSAMQPWAGTSCIIASTCYDKKCKRIASFFPVEVNGVDITYSSSTVTNGEGRSCAQFRMGGNVRVSSPYSQESQHIEGYALSSSTCPPEFDTLVLSPPGNANTGQCEEVILVVREPGATMEPSKTTKSTTPAERDLTTTVEPMVTTPKLNVTTPTTPPPTPPPPGLTVLTMDSAAQQALLADVEVRIIRPSVEIWPVPTEIPSTMSTGNFSLANFTMANFTDSNFTDSNFTDSNFTDSNFTDSNFTDSNFTAENFTTVNSSMTDSSANSPINATTNANGLALLDIPEDEPVIVVASKEGYLETSFTYSFLQGVKNFLPILVHKHILKDQFFFTAGENFRVDFRRPDGALYKFKIPPDSLNTTDGSNIEVSFYGVDTSEATELKEVPELIGLVESADEIKLVGLEAFSMAEVSVVNRETNDPVDVVLPFEAEFPLDRKSSGTRHGTRIPAWYFDKTTGTWKEDGVGKVKRNKAGELVWSFQATHFTWWSAMEPWPETSCIIIKTCYEKNCKHHAGFVPVEIHGVDFSYFSSSVTSEEGQTCSHFKMGGQVRVSSPCSKKPKFRTGSLGPTTYCPDDSHVLRPRDQTETGRCEQVVIVVKEEYSMSCSEPDIHTEANSTDVRVGDLTFFQCRDGYNLVGQSQRACLPCGKWSGPDPICAR